MIPTSEIIVTDDVDIDADELNHLYRLIGWDNNGRRTRQETTIMLNASLYVVHATNTRNELIGFARVFGDPYVAQVLDVITHPNYRSHGIATQLMSRIAAFLRTSNHVSVTPSDDSDIPGFYERFGFKPIREQRMKWQTGTIG